jgi:hypothetical protein
MTRRKKAQGPLVGSLWSKQLGQDYPDLKMADRAVGLLLAHYADYQTGRGARPSQETLAEALGISDRTVRASLKRLEEAGAIYCSGRWHRVKVWDLVLSNRNSASAYDDSKAEALSNVTGRDESGNRNDASDNQSEHPDRKGGSDDDTLRSAPQRVAPLALSKQRLAALATLLPESWQGAALSRSQESLAQAVAELDAAGWSHPQIRQGLSTLAALNQAKNPSALLAAHIQKMLAAGPADVVIVPKAQAQFWHDSKALKPYAEHLGIPVTMLAAICEGLHADGLTVTPLSSDDGYGREYWISVEDPKLPDDADYSASIYQESLSVWGPPVEEWQLERKHEDDLEWSTQVQRQFPAAVREMTQRMLSLYWEHRQDDLIRHLQAQGLIPTEASA